MTSIPRTKSGLLKHPLDGQTLVYEAATENVHLLDPATASVLELLEEGGWTAEGISIEVSRRHGVTADENFLILAFETLREADLLAPDTAPAPIDYGRRELLRKAVIAGASALLVPAVVSMTPNPSAAQTAVVNLCIGQSNPTGTQPGQPCSGDIQCCGPASTKKCVEFRRFAGDTLIKRCCFYDKGVGKLCTGDPPSGICCGFCTGSPAGSPHCS